MADTEKKGIVVFQNLQGDPMSTPVQPDPKKEGGFTYWPWFEDNSFPRRLMDAREGSPTNSGIISRKVLYTRGKGIEVVAKVPEMQERVDLFTERLNDGYGIDSLVERMAEDYYTFGMYCIIPHGIAGIIGGIDHLDASKVRKAWKEDKRAKGKIDGYVAVSDWSRATKKDLNSAIWYFEYKTGVTVTDNINYLMVRKRYCAGKNHYPLPEWYGGIRAAETELNTYIFLSASVQNNFNPSGILHVDPSLSEEEANKVAQDHATHMAGPSNAGKLIVMRSAGGDSGSRFEAMNSNPLSTEILAYKEACIEALVIAHNVPSRTLIGLPGGASLGGDGNTLYMASQLFMEQVIRPTRKLILSDIGKIYAAAGMPVEFKIEDIDLSAPEGETVSEEEAALIPNQNGNA